MKEKEKDFDTLASDILIELYNDIKEHETDLMEEGNFELSGQYHSSMEKGIRDHIAQIVNYITDNNIEVVSPHDGPSLRALGDVTQEVTPTMVSWYTSEYGLSNLARDVISAMGQKYPPEDENWPKKAAAEIERKGTEGEFTKYCDGDVTQACVDRAARGSSTKRKRQAAFAANVRGNDDLTYPKKSK